MQQLSNNVLFSTAFFLAGSEESKLARSPGGHLYLHWQNKTAYSVLLWVMRRLYVAVRCATDYTEYD